MPFFHFYFSLSASILFLYHSFYSNNLFLPRETLIAPKDLIHIRLLSLSSEPFLIIILRQFFSQPFSKCIIISHSYHPGFGHPLSIPPFRCCYIQGSYPLRNIG